MLSSNCPTPDKGLAGRSSSARSLADKHDLRAQGRRRKLFLAVFSKRSRRNFPSLTQIVELHTAAAAGAHIDHRRRLGVSAERLDGIALRFFCTGSEGVGLGAVSEAMSDWRSPAFGAARFNGRACVNLAVMA